MTDFTPAIDRRTVLKSIAAFAGMGFTIAGPVRAENTGRQIYFAEVGVEGEVAPTEIGDYRLRTVANDDLQSYVVRGTELHVLSKVLSNQEQTALENNDELLNSHGIIPFQSKIRPHDPTKYPPVSTFYDLRATEVVQSTHPVKFAEMGLNIRHDNALQISVGDDTDIASVGETVSITLQDRPVELQFINPDTDDTRNEQVQFTPRLLVRNNGELEIVKLQED